MLFRLIVLHGGEDYWIEPSCNISGLQLVTSGGKQEAKSFSRAEMGIAFETGGSGRWHQPATSLYVSKFPNSLPAWGPRVQTQSPGHIQAISDSLDWSKKQSPHFEGMSFKRPVAHTQLYHNPWTCLPPLMLTASACWRSLVNISVPWWAHNCSYWFGKRRHSLSRKWPYPRFLIRQWFSFSCRVYSPSNILTWLKGILLQWVFGSFFRVYPRC